MHCNILHQNILKYLYERRPLGYMNVGLMALFMSNYPLEELNEAIDQLVNEVWVISRHTPQLKDPAHYIAGGREISLTLEGMKRVEEGF